MLKLHVVATLALNLLLWVAVARGDTAVMGRTNEKPPTNPSVATEPVERQSVHFESLTRGRYRFLIEEVRWSDGSEARRIAAVYLEEDEPMELIVLDDFKPEPSLPNQENRRVILDETTALARFYFHVTATSINPERLAELANAPHSLPTCPPGERRAVARFAQPFKRARIACLGLEME
jgi:hypothetical protein